MKKLFFLFVCAAIAAACSSEMEVPSPVNPDDEMVEVSFNLAGDYVSVEETPMTRADEGKTYYFIQVYNIIPVHVQGSHFNYYNNLYAYGTFTSLENARMMLPSGYKLTYEVLVIKELGHKYDVCPFEVGLTGEFIYDDNFSKQLPLSNTYKITNWSPLEKIDRYYGKIEKKVNGPEVITIPLDRYSFSITFDVATPIDGSVVVGFSDPDENNYIYKKKDTDGDETKSFIFNAPLDAAKEQESVEVPIIIKWLRPGQEQAQEKYIVEEVVNVKRNTNYNIKIDLNGRADENSFGFTMNDSEWAQESVTVK
ncbi:MAG: hypothetical protein J6V52_02370 [Bacteroidaceae bacterium]|nr:hypothetical protein [Bacteroidaceae bacterium]